jgi:hypothetical protein
MLSALSGGEPPRLQGWTGEARLPFAKKEHAVKNSSVSREFYVDGLSGVQASQRIRQSLQVGGLHASNNHECVAFFQAGGFGS